MESNHPPLSGLSPLEGALPNADRFPAKPITPGQRIVYLLGAYRARR